MKIDVQCHAGYRGEEEPRAFTLGARNPVHDFAMPAGETRFAMDGAKRTLVGSVQKLMNLIKSVSQIAKESGALTIGVVTRPFTFEGMRRLQSAVVGIGKLKEHADTLIAIPNDRLLQVADKRASLQDAFRLADDVLHQGIQGISELMKSWWAARTGEFLVKHEKIEV